MTKYTELEPDGARRRLRVADRATRPGPWNKIAGSGELASKGSALKNAVFYRPGIQAWYNQFLDVDPADPNHVFVGLEEVYETEDGGSHWTTIGPYWNFDFQLLVGRSGAQHLSADDAFGSAFDRDRRRRACTSATTAGCSAVRCGAT